MIQWLFVQLAGRRHSYSPARLASSCDWRHKCTALRGTSCRFCSALHCKRIEPECHLNVIIIQVSLTHQLHVFSLDLADLLARVAQVFSVAEAGEGLFRVFGKLAMAPHVFPDHWSFHAALNDFHLAPPGGAPSRSILRYHTVLALTETAHTIHSDTVETPNRCCSGYLKTKQKTT